MTIKPIFESDSNNSNHFDFMRIGVVSSVDLKKCTARVYFEDKDDVVSAPLLVMQNNTMNSKSYWMPDIHESVICLFFSTGQESGIIIGSVYSEVDQPPPDVLQGNDRRGIWIDGFNYVKWIEEEGRFVVRTEKPIKFEVSPPWGEWE